jgi:two-component system OmpR family response regulator
VAVVRGKPWTVLVVVLDVDVRALIDHMLRGPEWHVFGAGTEAEALDVATSREIDVLLIEVTPSFHGYSIAERLRAHAPALPVLYVTGWHGHPDLPDLDGETVVREPFSRDELIGAIAAVLREPPS